MSRVGVSPAPRPSPPPPPSVASSPTITSTSTTTTSSASSSSSTTTTTTTIISQGLGAVLERRAEGEDSVLVIVRASCAGGKAPRFLPWAACAPMCLSSSFLLLFIWQNSHDY